MFGQSPTTTSNPMGPLTIPLISAGASIIGGLLGNRSRKRQQNRARAHDINMWDMTNAYNHPSEQMKRLRAAGLNPNLVYGGSSGQTAGTANSLPGAKAAQIEDIQPSNQMMQYINMKNTEAQTDNVRSQKGLNDANTILTNQKVKTELENTSLTGQNKINAQKQQKNLEQINNGLIQDNIFKTNRAKLSSEGRIGNENVIEQEWNKARLENPNTDPITIFDKMVKKYGERAMQFILDGSPIYNIYNHGKNMFDQF